jgi:hypothetical protein
MTIAIDDPRLEFLPFDSVDKAKPGPCQLYLNFWWVTHPDRGIVFWCPTKRRDYTMPQSNRDENVAKMIAMRLYPWAEVKLIERVLVNVPVG